VSAKEMRPTGVGWQPKAHRRRPIVRLATRTGVIGGAQRTVAGGNPSPPHSEWGAGGGRQISRVPFNI